MILLVALHSGAAHGVDPCATEFDRFQEAGLALRAPAPPAPAVDRFSDSELLVTALGLRNGGSPRLLVPELRAQLRELAGVASDEELRQPKVLASVFEKLRARMGVSDFEEALGMQASTIKATLRESLPGSFNETRQSRDLKDMNRGWGWKLLPDDDPAFQDPKFLAQLLKTSEASGEVMGLNRNGFGAFPEFSRAWSKIAPADVSSPGNFALTGTEANNLLYDIAVKAAEARGSRNARSAEILAFDGVYAGGGGRIGGLGFMHPNRELADLRIVSPHTPTWKPKDPAEIARLEALETQALDQIRARVLSLDGNPIGGLLLEPILGAKGVYFYRTEFLMKLRALCDELRIPIFADEILTGGGRTGKFFSYEHYRGFKPDFVTFGKGLQVAGVAQVQRKQSFGYRLPYRMVTLRQYDEALLKSAQVMNRIHDGRLMENAAEVGDYLIERIIETKRSYWKEQAQKSKADLQQKFSKARREARSELSGNPQALEARLHEIDAWRSQRLASNEEHFQSQLKRVERDAPRGMGLLIYGFLGGVTDAMGRLLPPMTLTKEQVDELLKL